MKKNVKCDKCNYVQGNELDGSEWNEFSDNYEDIIRTYWLCNSCHGKESKTMGSYKS